MKLLKNLLKIVPVLAMAYAGSAQALVINYTFDATMDARALAGFNAAAARWTSVLHDDVQVNMNIGFDKRPPNVLASAASTRHFYYYSDFQQALAADAKSSLDAAAVRGLPSGPCFSLYVNGGTDNPNGANSTTPFADKGCDANNAIIYMTQANARALGMWDARDTTSDGTLIFSNEFAWDFDPTDGITAGTTDFVGVATHEIGHALGFVSGVDIMDQLMNAPYPTSDLPVVAPADMFRCSAASKAAGTDLDLSADKRTKFFSLDNCANVLAIFSNGSANGDDGRQASHWKDDLGIGILDPTAGSGELLAISAMDLKMYDAIGWDVPEPASIALFTLGAAALAGSRRRKQK